MPRLSAGRVQSVATRLVVDRERERMRFRVASYWDLDGTFDAGSAHAERMFPAKLHSLDGARVARGSDFDESGNLKQGLTTRGDQAGTLVQHVDRARAEALVQALRRHHLRGPVGRGAALHPQALRAVPHHDAAAGGLAQARVRRLADDVGRAAALRERLHHLHEDRLDHAVGVGGQRGPLARSASSTAASTCRTHRARTPRRSRTPRRPTRRSARPATPSGPRRRPGSRATSSVSTS